MAIGHYRLIDVTPKGLFGVARDISAQGKVLAAAWKQDDVVCGLVWENGSAFSLMPEKGEDLNVRAINDAGLVVGSARVNDADYACVWRRGELHFLEAPGGEETSCAIDVNQHGIVVGYHPRQKDPLARACCFWVQSDYSSAWRYTEFFPDFLPFEYLGTEIAVGINDRCMIAGQVSRYGFLKIRDEYRKIESKDADGVMPHRINNEGLVVGYVIEPDEQYAFRYVSSLDRLPSIAGSKCSAFGLNDSGTIVGSSSHHRGRDDQHGCIWVEAKPYDLNDLVKGRGKYVITVAEAINNSGQIAATAELDGVDRAVLLTPM